MSWQIQIARLTSIRISLTRQLLSASEFNYLRDAADQRPTPRREDVALSARA